MFNKNPELRYRIKYIVIKYYYIRKRIDSGLLRFNYVFTKEINVDNLIKPLLKPDFFRFIDYIRLAVIKIEG